MVAGIRSVTRSANEVAGLAARAARGAGAPPQQAAEFGAAAVLHLGAGGAPDLLVAALHALPDGPIMALPLAIARVAEMAQTGCSARGALGTSHPLAHAYVAALPYHASLSNTGELVLELGRPAARNPVGRIELPDAVFEEWSALAKLLLVPESDVSRSSGAGAGLSDND